MGIALLQLGDVGAHHHAYAAAVLVRQAPHRVNYQVHGPQVLHPADKELTLGFDEHQPFVLYMPLSRIPNRFRH